MGFESFTAWKHDLDSIMEEVLHEYGLERTYMDNHEKHQDSTQWHRQQDEIRRTKEFEKEANYAKQQLSEIEWAICVELADLDDRIMSYGSESIEEVLNNPNGVYSNILFLAANCDDDRFEELDREGLELKEQMLREAMERAQDPIKEGLDQTISNINSGKKKMTWAERLRLWELYNKTSKDFWQFQADLRKDLQLDLDTACRKRRDAMRSYYDTLYYLKKTNSFIVLLITAASLLYQVQKRNTLSNEIADLKKQQQQLAMETSSFARFSRTYRNDLKAGNIPCEKCLENMRKIVTELDYEYQYFHTQERNMLKSLSRDTRECRVSRKPISHDL